LVDPTPVNDVISKESPALAAALSELGRQAIFPPDIPFQAAEARGKRYNATIGQITDGAGIAVELPSLSALLALFSEEDRNRATLYSPVEGVPELRELWRRWQRRHGPQAPSSLPLVTAGLTHGLSLVADLFGGSGRAVAVPAPFWGNYRQTFRLRTGAEVLSAPVYRDGSYNCEAIAEALADLPAGEPAVAILNLPSNPGGYSPTVDERRRLLASLVGVAESRPLVVVCDDAYAGLVYEPGVPAESMFWELAGVHDNLVPVKIDGGTKEFSFFGGRVGFITFPFAPDSAIAEALESKVKCLVRATIGSPVATTQMLLTQALRDGAVAEQVELADVDRELLRPQPFNSGCFALVELPEELSLDADLVRRHLLGQHDTGLIAVGDRYVRIAFCSVKADDLAAVVDRLEAGVAELAGRGAA
jgi:aspartate/methionine/tyrosine aminotransferase